MESRMNVSNWVDNRLAALDAAEWRPNAARAWAQLRERERARRRRRAGFLWGSLAAVAGALALMVVSSPQACATPNGCAEHVWHSVFPKHDAAPMVERTAPQPAPQPVTVAQARKPQPAPKKAATPTPALLTNFKEQGSPSATVTVEVFTDYECPTCAMLYRDFMPTLIAEYVK